MLALPFTLRAQEIKLQPTPFTAYLDFKSLATPGNRPPSFPIWLESVKADVKKKPDGTVTKTIYRFRFRKFPGINDTLMLRVFFDDEKDAQPLVSAWSEIGERVFVAKPLGQGIGLPSAETVTIPMAKVDYIEIETPGTGANVRGAFLSSLKAFETLGALDFDPPARLADPFQGPPPVQPRENDAYLFGRVKAALDYDVVKLSALDGRSTTVEFELATAPLLGVITFEILNAEVSHPPEIILNNHPLGVAVMPVPDLADPGFQGTVRPLERDMRFHYAGWLKCQKIVSGSTLQTGINRLTLQLGEPSGAVAVRSIEVQLKYNWDNLEYNLAP